MDEAKQRDERPQDSEADSLGQLLDTLCDEFESCWKQGGRPRIEDYIERISQERRGELLTHLLAVELYWRQRNSEGPLPEEYHDRFPEDSAIVDEQFQSDAHWQSVANAEAETAFLNAETQSLPDVEKPPQFGNYQIIEEIGRGGMGIVYRAWQPSADRYVALKLIRRDRFESLPRERQTSVIHRFEHEAQAAGRIQHDHIVTVYEVGEIDGEHFFSMRYVEGQSLTDLFKKGPLDGRRAAALLDPVARAVHEAHLHGILHRDLKPANILVDAKTDRAMVVDFGLAKLAEGAEDMTEIGDVMGTPPYMPPEQAEDSSQVTAKSDVYSLGATLYHALTGRPPFQAKTVLETIRLVADQAPRPPRQIAPRIDRDLETICLKCLEKDPARRYASAEALADELRRYLNHEPIEARPLGTFGRGLRWCHRYPVVASLLFCTVLFFMAALTASSVGYVQTSRALAVSERNYQWARTTVDKFYTRVSEEALLNQPGMQPLRQELLQLAMGYYEQFVKERGDDPTVRDELAVTAYRLGRITDELGSPEDAEPWYRRALGIQEQLIAQRPNDALLRQTLGDTLNAMGGVYLDQGELDDAKMSFGRAVEERQRLVQDAPGDNELQRKLANSHMNLGVVARTAHDWDEAMEQFKKAQSLRHEILEQDANHTKTRGDLAKGCFNLANLHVSIEPLDADNALANLEEALKLFEEQMVNRPNDLDGKFRTAVTANQYGDLLSHLRRIDEAQAPYQRALDIMQHLAYLNPDVTDYRWREAGIQMNLGLIETDEAVGRYAEARRILEQLINESPEEPIYVRDLGACLCATGRLAFDLGDRELALELMDQSEQLFIQLCREYPENKGYADLLQGVRKERGRVEAASEVPRESPETGAAEPATETLNTTN